eukprot:gene8137-16724_t
MLLYLYLVICLLRTGVADLPDIILYPIPTAELNITTSHATYAGTSGPIFISFIGDFSVSGPHRLGAFEEGTRVRKLIALDRVIGNLEKVILETNVTDGWLLSKLSCRIESFQYELTGNRQWLDTFDPLLENQHGHGYEPLAQKPFRDLPFAPQLQLIVFDRFVLT